jgi:hypothetical protein
MSRGRAVVGAARGSHAGPEQQQERFNADERRSEVMNANSPSGHQGNTPFDAGGQAIDCAGPFAFILLICVHLRLMLA